MSVVLSVLAGIALLFAGGESLVRGAVALARRLRVSPLLVGLVIVGFGTSTPELMVSLKAAWAGRTGMALGNVVGSNIVNILLVLGLASAISPLCVRPLTVRRDGLALLAAGVMLLLMGLGGRIDRVEGAVLLVALLVFVSYSYWTERHLSAPSGEMRQREAEEVSDLRLPVAGQALLLAAGMVAVAGGAQLLVNGAASLSIMLGLSDTAIGLSLVAAGTSLPELAASGLAALRGHTDVALGNVLGSNLFNALGILGATAAVSPIVVGPEAMASLWLMLGTVILLLPVLVSGWRLSRREGAFFLVVYAAYMFWLF